MHNLAFFLASFNIVFCHSLEAGSVEGRGGWRKAKDCIELERERERGMAEE